MISKITHNTTQKAEAFISAKLSDTLPPELYADIKFACEQIAANKSAFFNQYAKAARVYGKKVLTYSQTELNNAALICKGWQPPHQIQQAVRTLFLCNLSSANASELTDTLQQITSCGDSAEQMAIYQALAILPWPNELMFFCTEGLRSNMADVFESIANFNPYPYLYLSDEAFNQMVLKCVFVGKPLFRIVGLQQRCNIDLARMVMDYAAERWAAARSLSPEVWQLVTVLDVKHLPFYQKLAQSTIETEQQAASLLFYNNETAKKLGLFPTQQHQKQIENNQLSWQSLGLAVLNNL
jgi:hypothetical protein